MKDMTFLPAPLLFRRRVIAMVCMVALSLQTACYTYMPVQSSPPPEANPELAVVINDRGRTLLGERVGSLVEQIEGRLVRKDSVSITLQVHKVVDVRGNHSTWTGEVVQIPTEAIMGYRSKKLSKIKTALLIGGGIVALVLSLGRTLDIFGTPVEGPPGTDGPSQS